LDKLTLHPGDVAALVSSHLLSLIYSLSKRSNRIDLRDVARRDGLAHFL